MSSIDPFCTVHSHYILCAISWEWILNIALQSYPIKCVVFRPLTENVMSCNRWLYRSLCPGGQHASAPWGGLSDPNPSPSLPQFEEFHLQHHRRRHWCLLLSLWHERGQTDQVGTSANHQYSELWTRTRKHSTDRFISSKNKRANFFDKPSDGDQGFFNLQVKQTLGQSELIAAIQVGTVNTKAFHLNTVLQRSYWLHYLWNKL